MCIIINELIQGELPNGFYSDLIFMVDSLMIF